jgi:hypothetical protein
MYYYIQERICCMFTPRFWTLASMILAVAMTRVVPHPWNFTPVGALCLFGGAYFTQRWTAFVVPLVALVISDLVLAVTHYGMSSLLYLPPVYASFALIVGLGTLLRGQARVLPVTAAAIGAALMHFLITNLTVWMFQDIYPRTGAGLLACFAAALPFLQKMLAGNLIFCGILFGGFAWAQRRLPILREPATATAG